MTTKRSLLTTTLSTTSNKTSHGKEFGNSRKYWLIVDTSRETTRITGAHNTTSRLNGNLERPHGNLSLQPTKQESSKQILSQSQRTQENTTFFTLPDGNSRERSKWLRPKRLIRLANQAKLHSFCAKPIFMYGFQETSKPCLGYGIQRSKR